MTGPTVVEAAAPDTAPSILPERPTPVPDSAAFVRLLAQVLQGGEGPAAAPLAQRIGEAPDGLEGKARPKPESPGTEQSVASPLAALAVEFHLLALAPPMATALAEQSRAHAVVPAPESVATPSIVDTASVAAAAGPEAPAMTKAVDVTPELSKVPLPPASTEPPWPQEAAARAPHFDSPALSPTDSVETPRIADTASVAAAAAPEAPAMTERADITPTAAADPRPELSKIALSPASTELPRPQEAGSRRPHPDRPAMAPARASAEVLMDPAPLAATAEELSSPTQNAHSVRPAPEARPEAASMIGAAGYGESSGSSDPDAAGHRDRGGREPVNVIDGALSTPKALEGQAAAPASETSTRSAAAPRAPVEQVAERVALAHRDGRQEVSFRLDPPELGAVRIQAVLEGQRLTLHIRTEQESARAALEQALPQLKESLSQQGIVAGRVTVELGLDTSAQGFAGEGFAGHARQEPAEPPARSRDSGLRSTQRQERATQGFDLWV